MAPPPGHRHGPPAHAPAWGYRAKHEYRYYPDAFVYYDVYRNIYFYMDGGTWRMTATLPGSYDARLGGYVVIDLDTDSPYEYFERHRHEYPPGKWKRYKKKKHKKW